MDVYTETFELNKSCVLLQAEKKHKSFQELDRFMHYYTRFKNHEHSYKVIRSPHVHTHTHTHNYSGAKFHTYVTI